MYPFKKFLKGPNLHDESVTRNLDQQQSYPKNETFSGEEAKKVYEEIISLPSNPAASASRSSRDLQVVVAKQCSTELLRPKLEKLNLNQLLKHCELDNHKELRSYLQEYYREMNLDEKDDFGWTMLMSAACAGASGTVKLLLEAGADWEICDKKGLTALLLAKKNGKKQTCQVIEDWQHFIQNQASSSPEIIELEMDGNLSSNSNDPVYCDACEMHFSNQKEHLKSIAHLFSSGEMKIGEKVHYGIPESNKGFQMMLRTGWNKNVGLGSDGQGQKFPVKTVLKRDREGVGNERDKKAARITHFGPFDPAAVENPRRLERAATIQKREDVQRLGKERRKEIHLRRELGQFDSL